MIIANVMREPASSLVIPSARSAMFTRAFAWYTRRLLRKKFHRVLLAREPGGAPDAEPLAALNREATPALVLLNHSSWWDPLIGLHLHATFTPARAPLGVIEAAQLRSFAFFRRLGVFGLDHRAPGALDAMRAYVRGEFLREPRTLFWLTPQGAFSDVRLPVRPRPGAAALAHDLSARVVCVASELVFWADQRPELLLRIVECPAPATSSSHHVTSPPSLLSWQRAITRTMNDNADALARLAVARDPEPFSVLLSGKGGVNPAFDAWQRARGKRSTIDLAAGQGRAPSPRSPSLAPAPTPPEASA